MRREWEEPFDLGRGPVLRLKLLRLGERDHILLRTFHHIACGRLVGGRVQSRVCGAVRGLRRGAARIRWSRLAVQYADFALWQRSWLDEAALGHGLEYWKGQLSGIAERLELPTDRPPPAVQTYAAALCSVSVPAQRVVALRRLSQANQGNAVHDAARGVRAAAGALQRAGGHRGGFADRQPPGERSLSS